MWRRKHGRNHDFGFLAYHHLVVIDYFDDRAGHHNHDGGDNNFNRGCHYDHAVGR